MEELELRKCHYGRGITVAIQVLKGNVVTFLQFGKGRCLCAIKSSGKMSYDDNYYASNPRRSNIMPKNLQGMVVAHPTVQA